MSPWDAVVDGADLDDDIVAQLPPLAALSDVPQTACHHREGDVLTHTRMVAAVADRLLESDPSLAGACGGHGATVLRLAAVLHDAGKPACTVDAGDGRFPARGHELESARVVAELSMADPWWRTLPLAVRWAVHTAVRNHMWVYAARAGRLSRGAAVRSSHLVDPATLAALWHADVEGRVCDDADDLDEARRWAALVLDDLQAAVPAALPWAGTLGVDAAELDPRVRHEVLRAVVLGHVDGPGALHAKVADARRSGRGSTLTYTIGLPGAGKSTWSDTEAAATGASVLRAEGRRARDRKAAHGALRDALPGLLHEGTDVIIDATHVDRTSRERWIEQAATYGASVRAVWFDTSLPETLSRQRTRPARDAVPADVVEKMARNLRMPTPDEYAVLDVVDADGRSRRVTDAVGWWQTAGPS